MKLEDISVKQYLRLLLCIFILECNCTVTFLMTAPLVDTLIPIQLLDELSEQVDRLTVASEDDHLLVLMAVKEDEEVYEPILGRHLNPELLDLFRDRPNIVFLLALVFNISFETDFSEVFHELRP